MNNLVIQGLRNDELDLKRQLSELSEKFGPKHPQIIRLNSQLETVQKNIIAEARKMLNTAKTELDIARNRETSLRRTIEEQKQEVLDLSRKAIDFNVIAGESASNKQFYDLLLKKLQEASLSSGINVSNLQIVDFAVPPKEPAEAAPGDAAALAVFLGLFGGLFVAFFAEYMDNTIKTAEDVEKLLKLPFLDIVPLTEDEGRAALHDRRPDLGGRRVLPHDPHRRAALLGRHAPAGHPRDQLRPRTRARPPSPPTWRVAMAQSGERVLVVDTDMRRHNLHELFGLEAEPGLTDAAAVPARRSRRHQEGGRAPQPLRPDRRQPGAEPLGAARLAADEGVRRLRAAGGSTAIILDAPPLRVFSDALVLSQIADGVILVVWGGTTPRPLIQQSVESLRAVKANILGVVLNKIDITRQSDYYSPYYYSYYSDKKGKKRKRR